MADTFHEEEVLGKAYDSSLMRRLLEYLRPYWLVVLVALVATLLYGGLPSRSALPDEDGGGPLSRSHGPRRAPALAGAVLDLEPPGGHFADRIGLLSPHGDSDLLPGIRADVRHAARGAESDVRPPEADIRPPPAAADELL